MTTNSSQVSVIEKNGVTPVNGGSAEASAAPANAKIVLASLIIVAAVANLPLAMANVALPSIGAYFDASQTQLNLVAVGYSLGLACSVLWLGALGDRYGRKLMLILGVTLAIPAALIGGLRADDRDPDRRAALRRVCGWHGLPDHPGPDRCACGRDRPARARSRCGRPSAAPSPLCGRCCPASCWNSFAWSSVFVVIIPLAVVALFMASKYVPAHVNETTEPVDNLGGILSVVLVGALILAINFAPVPNMGTLVAGSGRGHGRGG